MLARTLFGAAALCVCLEAQQAVFSTYGTGCYSQRQSFYELFNSGTFDLSGTTSAPGGFSMIFIGDGYLVLPALTSWHPPSGSAQVLALGDDQVTADPGLPFGFTMPYPGGSTDHVWVSSNGFVFLQSSAQNGCCGGNVSSFLSDAPRVSPLWSDLNPGPSGGGTVTFEVDGASGIAYVTFANVPEYSSGGSNTFQIAFQAFGEIDVLYGPCANISHTALAGWTPGVGSSDPGPIDINTTVPQVLVTGTDRDPLQLGSSTRPRIGQLMQLVTTNIPAGSSSAMLVLGGTQFPLGVDLGTYGMPGCPLYTDIVLTFFATGSGSSATLPLIIPSDMGLVGQRAYMQSAALSPGQNQLGFVSSNGAVLVFGTL